MLTPYLQFNKTISELENRLTVTTAEKENLQLRLKQIEEEKNKLREKYDTCYAQKSRGTSDLRLTEIQKKVEKITNQLLKETAEKEKIQRESLEKENEIQKRENETNLLTENYEKLLKESVNRSVWIAAGTTVVSLLLFFEMQA